MLLVTMDGDIVYSLKRESDLAQNVVSGPLKETNLGRHFHRGLEEVVITDFELYALSGNRPISFLIAPIELFGSTEGVVVLKLTIGAINTIMMERSGMGETGEALPGGAGQAHALRFVSRARVSHR